MLLLKTAVRAPKKGYNLDKFKFKKETGKNSLTNRVVDEWNRLRRCVVKANTNERFNGCQRHIWTGREFGEQPLSKSYLV